MLEIVSSNPMLDSSWEVYSVTALTLSAKSRSFHAIFSPSLFYLSASFVSLGLVIRLGLGIFCEVIVLCKENKIWSIAIKLSLS